jgi:hypothetical protein
MQQLQAIVFTGPGQIELQNFDVPVPGPDDIQVRALQGEQEQLLACF